MNESERLAQQIEKAIFGEAWYGPSWREVLEGLTLEAALHRPIPEAHSIAEVVLHATTWHDVVRRRIQGETPEVSDAQDWPPVTAFGNETWTATKDRLLETGRALCDTIRKFPPERLQDSRPGLSAKDTWYDLIVGEMQHVLYHAGQVGVLKKSAVRVSV